MTWFRAVFRYSFSFGCFFFFLACSICWCERLRAEPPGPTYQRELLAPQEWKRVDSVYYCSLGMFQLGGTHWEKFYPGLVRVLLANQRADGSWPAEANRDGHFGDSYTTALVVLALTPPYQLLPIYQR